MPFTYKDCVSYLQKNDVSFVSICITPWHLKGAAAFINQLSDPKTDGKHGLFIIQPHPTTGYCLREDDVSKMINYPCVIKMGEMGYNNLTFKRIYYCLLHYIHFRKKLPNIYLLTPASTFVFFQLSIFNDLKIRFKQVVIDEGVSGYLSPQGWLHHSYLESKRLYPALVMFLRKHLSLSLESFMNIEIINWMLYTPKGKQLSINQEVANSYLKLYGINNVKPTVEIHSKNIIFLSQPFNNSEYYQLIINIVKVIGSIAAKKGYTLYVKLHPRDDKEVWKRLENITVLNVDGPIEDIYNSLINKPQMLIGINSTALLTLHAFYQTNCATIVPLLCKMSNKRLNYDEKFFLRMFRNEINVIEDLSQFSTLL